MNPEQVDRAIEFILNEQARITTSFEMWTEEFRLDIKELKESQAHTDAQIRLLREAQSDTDGKIRALIVSQEKTDDSVRHLSKQQTRTSGELETFMAAMTQFITEMRNKP